MAFDKSEGVVKTQISPAVVSTACVSEKMKGWAALHLDSANFDLCSPLVARTEIETRGPPSVFEGGDFSFSVLVSTALCSGGLPAAAC